MQHESTARNTVLVRQSVHGRRWARDIDRLTVRHYAPRQPPARQIIVPDDFGHWLAGFIDGEGSFAIRAAQASFTINLRFDDSAILAEIMEQTGIGTFGHRAARAHVHGGYESRPQVVWRVSSKADCLALVGLLDRYPLRAKKARDFAVWREAVIAWQLPGVLDRSAWERLQSQLTEARAYPRGGRARTGQDA